MEIPADELAVEQAAALEVKEDEVRAKVIDEFGFDETDDAERIDKAVAKEVESRKQLSAAIGQKIKHRTEAEELRKQVPPPAPSKPADTTKPEDIEKVVASTLEKRDLDALEYPDKLKGEIQRIAQAQNVSIKTALRDPYIAFKIEEHAKAAQADEAAISRTNKSDSKRSFSVDAPPDADMTTEEGRKTWDDYKTWMRDQGN